MHRDLVLRHFGVCVQSNWTCGSSDQAARGFQRVNVIEDPSTLKECKIISADISNMYPSLPIAMMIQVSHVVIDEAFRRAALTLGLKMKYEHIREINAMPLRELQKLAGEMDLPNKSQWEAIPLSRIVELREMIVLHCARRHEDRVVIQISDMRHRHRKSTPAFKVLEPGTLKVDINQVNDHLLITRDVLKNWIVVALRNQYVTVGGKVKRQTRGLAQGKADAVRLSALVLSFYEIRNGVRPPLLP